MVSTFINEKGKTVKLDISFLPDSQKLKLVEVSSNVKKPDVLVINKPTIKKVIKKK